MSAITTTNVPLGTTGDTIELPKPIGEKNKKEAKNKDSINQVFKSAAHTSYDVLTPVVGGLVTGASAPLIGPELAAIAGKSAQESSKALAPRAQATSNRSIDWVSKPSNKDS